MIPLFARFGKPRPACPSLLAAVLMAATSASGASTGNGLTAGWFERKITPAVGTRLAGYGPNDVSVGKYDELLASGICLDDGSNRVMLVSLDLLGLDYGSIREIRRRVSRVTGVPEGGVMVTCTHTHQGPHTRMYDRKNGLVGEGGFAFDETYTAFLFSAVEEAAKEMASKPFRPYLLGYYSAMCDENRNRRYTTSDNHASFNAHRPFLHRISDGIADKELGTLVLLDGRNAPAYVIGNYAAHPLTAHAPGYGGLRISSDFPGFYRRYIESETGAKAMFVQGAAGNLVTKNDECGNAAARRVGENLAMASITGIISAQRCHARYVFRAPRVGWETRTFTSRLRKKWRGLLGRETETFEVQCLAVGDVCFVGVPGEILNELGLEIKWNSPFARTYIAYLATGYCGYITPMNFLAAGGYEPQSHRFAARDTLTLVRTAQDAMLALRARLFPGSDDGDDPYPDNLYPPIVNVPGMYKDSKKER